jgi:hypothetical protein
LVGMGGGAGLRRTCGPPAPLCCWAEVKWPGRVGRERVDALDADRLRSFSASRLPSKPGGCVACVGKAGTMSFLAGAFGLWCKFAAELFDVLGLAKSTVLAR